MPLLEAPETTESSEPSGTAGATTPGTGTLAGAWMALAGTFVPSGRLPDPLSAEDAFALLVTRLAVQTPEISARGTKVNALLRRDKVFVVMRVSPSPVDKSADQPRAADTLFQRPFPVWVTYKPAL